MSESTTNETKYKPTSPTSKLDFASLWEYAPAPESAANLEVKKRYELFIDGKFVKPAKGRYFKSTNPANGTEVSEFAEATQKDVDKAVKSARKAFEGEWSKVSAKTRAKYIYRIARMLQERAREFAIAESLAGWADKLDFAFPGKKPEPLGVCGQIIPWNFPILMLAWKIAPALACGNTVVLKPAETTSLTAMLFAELVKDAGLPDGVVNIVTGAGQTGAEIVAHKDINKIAFTGSTKVGKIIKRSLAGTDKKYTLELGGKGALIIFEDAAIDQAVEGIINAIYFNQGHVCCAGSRLFVQESVADKVIQKLKDRLETLIVGDPLDKNTDIGAINSRQQFENINKYLEINAIEVKDSML